MAISTPTKVDAFTTEVIRTSVYSITEEMKTTLQRTAYSPMIYEMRDFAVGLFDGEGSTVSLGFGVIMWVGGMSEMIKLQVARWGKDHVHPGDMLLTNDVSVHGSHVNHFIFTQPIFFDGEIIAYASAMAHWLDVGGVLGGRTRDVFEEGFFIPNVKIYKEGVLNDDILDTIRANVRFPERAMGDVRAQIATVKTGERRVLALVERYGIDAFRESLQLIYDQSERQARAAVRAIPDGVYTAETFLDNDGINLDIRLPVKVKVIVGGDEMTIDLSECAPENPGNQNCGPTAGKSGAEVAFKTLTLPTAVPVNVGAFRPLTVILPPGLALSASRRAARRGWTNMPDTVVDTVWKALTPILPQRGPAGHHTTIGASWFQLFEDENGRMAPRGGQFVGGIMGGGWGAVYNKDGESATVAINDSDVQNSPVEAGEADSPAIMVRRALDPDSGGPGRYRGGLGLAQQISPLVPAMIEFGMEHTLAKPWGALGGKEGLANRVTYERGDGSVERFPTGKTPMLRVVPGESATAYQGGGGGFGDPLDRPVEAVLDDVSDEYVSIESAPRDYGVVIVKDGPRHYRVDVEATAQLRRDRRAQA